MCGISEFEENEKKCVCFLYTCLQFLQLYSFTYATYKPSHHNHSIIPLSNHHTIIIPKSHNLRNIIYIYRSSYMNICARARAWLHCSSTCAYITTLYCTNCCRCFPATRLSTPSLDLLCFSSRRTEPCCVFRRSSVLYISIFYRSEEAGI